MENAKCQKALSMIGLAKKAGRIVFGVPMVTEALRGGKLSLVVYATGASENSVKRVTDKAKFYETELLGIDVTPSVLGHSIGKVGAVSAVGIADAGFAAAIAKIFED